MRIHSRWDGKLVQRSRTGGERKSYLDYERIKLKGEGEK